MDKNASLTLGDHFISFIEAQIGQGRFNSASDVVHAAWRLLPVGYLAEPRSQIQDIQIKKIPPRLLAGAGEPEKLLR